MLLVLPKRFLGPSYSHFDELEGLAETRKRRECRHDHKCYSVHRAGRHYSTMVTSDKSIVNLTRNSIPELFRRITCPDRQCSYIKSWEKE
ncbi:uncharacterized protein PHALS_07318 [Plasmopara halstedii]|uniref:Uncharacterized protein n=1 Tax=Plasmopara halstedii TaxID=4781 RepID=A0A0P1B5T1_PLAHL|nr:uncharacterized protein PHALS_07318 [Plasmopara halstedii]CEG49560.1 hypothetical protein PHALS_07318 [Plasmopara halstedii]|eukprot:XP_024585929.1 hypothetical protein PHALS_07318 [Plasmopara halstedii]